MEELLKKISSKESRIGIIGLGYVGLPLACEFADENFAVTGFDIDRNKIESISSRKSYIKHIKSARLTNFKDATTDFSLLQKMDVIIICLPTPLNMYREPDLSYITSNGEVISKYLRRDQLVILESTTYPGTTNEVLRPILEKSGLLCGVDFYLGYSPEREDPNNQSFVTKNIPKVISGETDNCLKLVKALYDQVFVKTVPVSSTQCAEAAKLLENIYRCVNIALVNELKILFDRMNINIWEVIGAASTKPFGFAPFYPGPGLGGHCIPIDPFYLSWKAKAFEIPARFIELAGEINISMPYYVVSKTMEALNKHKKSLNGSQILILGAAYKKDIDDVRESPSIRLIELLEERGSIVSYNDPYIPSIPKMRAHKVEMESTSISKESLNFFDCVIISTDHSSYDYDFIVKESEIVIDSRNATKNVTNNREKIFLA